MTITTGQQTLVYLKNKQTMNEYLFLTPGPLTTSDTVKQAMLTDWCFIDKDFSNDIFNTVTHNLVKLACPEAYRSQYAAVLLNGNIVHSIETLLNSAISQEQTLLVVNNGRQSQTVLDIARMLGIKTLEYALAHNQAADARQFAQLFEQHPEISHVYLVHCQNCSGLLNPLESCCQYIKAYHKTLIVDAISTFGGIAINVHQLGIDYLVANAEHGLQSLSGLSFVIAKQSLLHQCEGRSKSFSLDLYQHYKIQAQLQNQSNTLFAPNAQLVAALHQALVELEDEGGIEARALRFGVNQKLLCQGMNNLGFEPLLDKNDQSSIVTSFAAPNHKSYAFEHFYQLLKHQGFIIFPGDIDGVDCFRIGNIGQVYPTDIKSALLTIEKCRYWLHE